MRDMLRSEIAQVHGLLNAPEDTTGARNGLAAASAALIVARRSAEMRRRIGAAAPIGSEGNAHRRRGSIAPGGAPVARLRPNFHAVAGTGLRARRRRAIFREPVGALLLR